MKTKKQQEKQVYHCPELHCFGKVEDITLSASQYGQEKSPNQKQKRGVADG